MFGKSRRIRAATRQTCKRKRNDIFEVTLKTGVSVKIVPLRMFFTRNSLEAEYKQYEKIDSPIFFSVFIRDSKFVRR